MLITNQRLELSTRTLALHTLPKYVSQLVLQNSSIFCQSEIWSTDDNTHYEVQKELFKQLLNNVLNSQFFHSLIVTVIVTINLSVPFSIRVDYQS